MFYNQPDRFPAQPRPGRPAGVQPRPARWAPGTASFAVPCAHWPAGHASSGDGRGLHGPRPLEVDATRQMSRRLVSVKSLSPASVLLLPGKGTWWFLPSVATMRTRMRIKIKATTQRTWPRLQLPQTSHEVHGDNKKDESQTAGQHLHVNQCPRSRFQTGEAFLTNNEAETTPDASTGQPR